MGNQKRKFRKVARSGNPAVRGSAVKVRPAGGHHAHMPGFHGHWLNVATGQLDDHGGPEHSMDCVFMGGTAGPDGCFTCYLVAHADRVLATGKGDNFRNDDDGYCVQVLPDSKMQAPHQKMVIDGVAVPADWRLGRHDGRELFFWKLGEEHEREHVGGAGFK